MAEDFDIEQLAAILAEAKRPKRAVLPKELEEVREAAKRAVAPLKPADENTRAHAKFLFNAVRTDAGRNLPPYYLVYFLLVDLLGFRDLGRFEKLAWSVPIDLDGEAYLIEHRKFGVGVFARKGDLSERQAQRIVVLIKKGVKAAKPFFKWMATKAVEESKINISNVGITLFERYAYFRDSFRVAEAEADAGKREYDAKQEQREFKIQLYSLDPQRTRSTQELIAAFTPSWSRQKQAASWLALAAIDAFFAWTEHIFIHLAILQSRVTTGAEVTKLVGTEWHEKFKCALDVGDPVTKRHFDELLTIRRQLRNFVAHGAFGKEGEAFHFHSRAGAVPVAFDRRLSKPHLSLTPELGFDDTEALAAIGRFVDHLWSGARAPAKIYIQDHGLPLILTMASDGRYGVAMASTDNMNSFVDDLTAQIDNSANMDW
jgi:hypothetical protein